MPDPIDPPPTYGDTTTSTGGSGLFGGLSINDIINAGLAIYGIQQGKSAPKFYVAPETPGEQWKTGATQNLYNMASAFTDQYLKGLSNLNPNFSLSTPFLGNPAFMGGVRVPTFDFSKIPSSAAPTTSTPSTSTPSGSTGGPAAIGNPFNSNMNDPTAAGDPFAGFPTGDQGTSGPDPSSVVGWMQSHPNIVQGGEAAVAAGLAATFGIPGGLAAKIGGWLLNTYLKNHPQGNKNTPPSNQPTNLTDVTDPRNPNEKNVHIDPSTGLWSMDNPSPGDQAWLNSINSNIRGWMTGPGDPGYGQFGGGFGNDPFGSYGGYHI